ncbi:hypothetical protein Q2T46_11555 [Thermoanaerobacterium sp. CMT5567-10]|uniref:hypothetical protein n=1 Tax=Thermoanaerobacterium sp. CMT5567-10 TaxID=3061989 RepID=UPI0026E098A8|nr:hypothetical protein [Thermoanaerobacterium sp. CMT5567-10]WKV08162.1 hypothetical protein Q2T46_11555 [Thermoanaerobacterium sp. CMT5567-10]
MEEVLKQRINELEKRVTALEGRIPEQPKEIELKIDGEMIAKIVAAAIKKGVEEAYCEDTHS